MDISEEYIQPPIEMTDIPQNDLDKELLGLMKSLPYNPSWIMMITDKNQIIGFVGQMHRKSSIEDELMNKEDFANLFLKNINSNIQNLSEMRLGPLHKGVFSTVWGITIFYRIGDMGRFQDHYLVICYNKSGFSPDIIHKLGSIFHVHIHDRIGRIYQAIHKVLPK